MKLKWRYAALRAGPLLVAASLGLSACGDGLTQPQGVSETVLSSCVRAPHLDAGISVRQLVQFLESKGASIAWESEGSNHILRSSLPDRLTGQTASFDFDFSIRPTNASEGVFSTCGPDRAVVTRALTPGGIVDGVVLDNLIASFAEWTREQEAGATVSAPAEAPIVNAPSEAVADAAAASEPDVPSMTIPTSGTGAGTCNVKLAGRPVMAGRCSGAFHKDSVVLGTGRDGCHVDLRWTGEDAQAFIYSYRDVCENPATGESIDQDISLGLVRRDGRCWRNSEMEVCLD